ncbi:MAG TPA: aldolase/citrate lyase family protein, partial [SAR86 cluster bacterium]|nr:aldolase/citrate lyase family protein [SAR86 cluster bacterium]
MKKFPISPIFVPANKLDWIEKTYDKGADAVIIDLEDSVSNELKADARSNLVSFLKTKESDRTLLVRVNPIDQQTGLEDIKILSEISSKIDAFVL